MLTEYGIVAASPELGTVDRESYGFFIFDRSVLLRILHQNAHWVLGTYRKLGADLGFNHQKTYALSENYVYDGTQPKLRNDTITLDYDVLNKGFSDL